MKYIVLIIPLLVACTPQVCKPVIPQKVEIPANLTQECPPIPEWADETFGSIVKHDTELMGEYSTCRNKHKELVNGLDKQK